MLHWNDGTWEHRAYWGANNIAYGTDGTASRLYMGPLPPAGQWNRLEIPATQLGLEGSTLTGMSFSQFDGRATWDFAGKALLSDTSVPPVVIPPPVIVPPPGIVPPLGGSTNPIVLGTNELSNVSVVTD